MEKAKAPSAKPIEVINKEEFSHASMKLDEDTTLQLVDAPESKQTYASIWKDSKLPLVAIWMDGETACIQIRKDVDVKITHVQA